MKNYSLPEKPSGIIGVVAGVIMLLRHRRSYKLAWKALDLCDQDTFLEIGFGLGNFLKKAGGVASFVAGLDHGKDMVKIAKLMNKTKILSGKMDIRLGEASSLPWDDESFTSAAIIEAFYYLSNPKKTLLEVYRVLRESGRIVITMIWYRDGKRSYKVIEEKYNATIFSVDSLKTLLGEIGFKNVYVKVTDGVLLALAYK